MKPKQRFDNSWLAGSSFGNVALLRVGICEMAGILIGASISDLLTGQYPGYLLSLSALLISSPIFVLAFRYSKRYYVTISTLISLLGIGLGIVGVSYAYGFGNNPNMSLAVWGVLFASLTLGIRGLLVSSIAATSCFALVWVLSDQQLWPTPDNLSYADFRVQVVTSCVYWLILIAVPLYYHVQYQRKMVVQLATMMAAKLPTRAEELGVPFYDPVQDKRR